MRHVLSILFGAGFTVATAWALGRILFARLRLTLWPLEHQLLAGVVGSALLSSVIFWICAAGVAWSGVFLGLGAIAAYLSWPFLNGRGSAGVAVGWLRWIWWLVFAVFAYVYLVNALAPDYSPDGQTYHLGLVYRMFRDHGFARITTNFYANMPLGVEMLFLNAFAFGRQSAAVLVECCALLTLPFLIVCYGRRIGCPAAGGGAALLVFLAPIAGHAGTTAYNDVFLVTASFAAFYLAEIWREEPESIGLAVAAGLVAGFCFGIKYTGFPAVLYVALTMWRKPKMLAIALLAAACMALPWLVKNWIMVGNPVSPFFNRIFPNPYIHQAFEDFTRTWFRRYGVPDLTTWPWMVTVSGRLAGQTGPWFLLAPLGLIALRWKPGRRILLAALLFAIPYPQNISARFLLPVLPFVALAMALVLAQWRGALPALVAIAAVLAWPRMTAKYEVPGNVRIHDIPWKAALRIIPQDDFMASRSVPWMTARMLDTDVPQGKRVVTTTPVAEGYMKTDVMVTYQSAEGDDLQDLLTGAYQGDSSEPRKLATSKFRQHGLSYLLIDDGNWVAADIRKGPERWNMKFINERAGNRLYMLN